MTKSSFWSKMSIATLVAVMRATQKRESRKPKRKKLPNPSVGVEENVRKMNIAPSCHGAQRRANVIRVKALRRMSLDLSIGYEEIHFDRPTWHDVKDPE